MNRDDWFRSPDWDEAAQELFAKKLRRSRTAYNRAQYIKPKAFSLFQTRDAAKLEAAIGLLRGGIEEYGSSADFGVRFMVMEMHELLARAYERSARLDMAEREYRRAIELCTSQPTTPGDSELRLAELIVRTLQTEKFPEARALISLDPVFSDKRFRYLTAEARMAALEGDARKAAICAGAALGVLKHQTPPLSRLPAFGVARPDSATIEELQELAALPGPAREDDRELLPAWLLRAGAARESTH